MNERWISYLANRYARVNNEHMNSHSGWAMRQYLSTGGFKQLSESEINNANLGKYTEESNKGLTLEVDLDYPEQLHESHDDFPLAAEKILSFSIKAWYPIIEKEYDKIQASGN